jgi:hypothetical protein
MMRRHFRATGFQLDTDAGAATISASADIYGDTMGALRIDGSFDDGTANGGSFRTVGCLLN